MKKISPLTISAIVVLISGLPVFAASEVANINASIQESLSLTLGSESLDFNIEDDLLNTQTLVVSATTNNATGYTISFNVNNEYDDLKHFNTLVDESIPTLLEEVLTDNFSEKAWGYSTDGLSFSPASILAKNVFSSTRKGSGSYDFIVGIRAPLDMVAGSYENELIFTAIANPEPEGTFDYLLSTNGVERVNNYYPMQSLTPEICTKVDNGEKTRMIDLRDSKIYWVGKMADGNCWMTQNLDFVISSSGTTLYPETSDVLAEKTITASGKECFSQNQFFTAASGTPQDYDTIGGENAYHYYGGTYYYYSIATAKSSVVNNEATESICPANWNLPPIDKFTNLMDIYDITSTTEFTYTAKGRGAPLYMGGTGNTWSGGGIANGNSATNYISSTQKSDDSSKYLRFFNGVISVTEKNGTYGFSIRCVVGE